LIPLLQLPAQHGDRGREQGETTGHARDRCGVGQGGPRPRGADGRAVGAQADLGELFAPDSALARRIWAARLDALKRGLA
jgi:hypothetical protein